MRSPRSATRAAATCTLAAIAVATAGCSISPQSEATVVGPAPVLEESAVTTEATDPPVLPGREEVVPPSDQIPREEREAATEDGG